MIIILNVKYNNISKSPKNHNKKKDKRDRLKILINNDFIYQINITLLIININMQSNIVFVNNLYYLY